MKKGPASAGALYQQQGRLHVHALLRGTDGLTTEQLKRWWQPGHCDATVYDLALGARYYAKYIGGDIVDYDLSAPPKAG